MNPLNRQQCLRSSAWGKTIIFFNQICFLDNISDKTLYTGELHYHSPDFPSSLILRIWPKKLDHGAEHDQDADSDKRHMCLIVCFHVHCSLGECKFQTNAVSLFHFAVRFTHSRLCLLICCFLSTRAFKFKKEERRRERDGEVVTLRWEFQFSVHVSSSQMCVTASDRPLA